VSRAAERTGARGVTLVELLVVLAILALTAAVVAPAIARREPSDDLATASMALRAVLTRAQQAALSRGEGVTLTIDPATGRYWIASASAEMPSTLATASDRSMRGRDPGPASDSIALPSGTRMAAAAPRVHYRFSPTGSAFGEPITLHREGRSVTVELDPWAGDPRRRPE
jgi:type II secretion system protein H